MQSLTSGDLAGIGSFRCIECDYVVALTGAEMLPSCPSCGGEEFTRASLFSTAALPTTEFTPDPEPAGWLAAARDGLEAPGKYLVYEEGDEAVVVELSREWTRIGRSLAADVRFDDPTVSRRHALIVQQPDGVRLLDDRSLNGVFVNGERVEWKRLADGDEIVVGRHHLHFCDLAAVSGMRDAGELEDEPQALAG
jgi:predicted  nucleic acid-binding Zn-ribbon protein